MNQPQPQDQNSLKSEQRSQAPKLENFIITAMVDEGKCEILGSSSAGAYGRHIIARLEQTGSSANEAAYTCPQMARLQFVDSQGRALGPLVPVSKLELQLKRPVNGEAKLICLVAKALDAEGKIITPPPQSVDQILDTVLFEEAPQRSGELLPAEIPETQAAPSMPPRKQLEPARPSPAAKAASGANVKPAQPKEDAYAPVEFDAKPVEAFVQLLRLEGEALQLEMTKQNKEGLNWALALLEGCKQKCPEGEDFTQYLAKRVQLTLHPKNTQAGELAARLVGFYSGIIDGASGWHRLSPSKKQRLRSEARPFAEELKRRFGSGGGEAIAGVYEKIKTIDQLLERLKSFDWSKKSGRPSAQALLEQVAGIVNQEIRRKPADSERRKAHAAKISQVIKLARDNGPVVLHDQKKKQYDDQLKSLQTRAARNKDDYGYEARASATAKHAEKGKQG